jgi:hypothetical protein
MTEKNLPPAGARTACHDSRLADTGDGSRHDPAPGNEGKGEDKKTPPAATFTIEQRVLPGLLGIAIERVRELRRAVCQEGVDWQQERGRCLWSEAGIEQLRRALAVPSDDFGGGGGEGPADTRIEARSADSAQRTNTVRTEACPAGIESGPPPKKLPPLVVRRAGPVIRNRRIVEVVWEAEADSKAQSGNTPMLLWVRDNRGFRPGQKVTEFRERGVEGQFDYTGRYVRRIEP